MAKLDQDVITQAALEIVESDQHEELTLTAIARYLEVTQPALYYHVRGVEDVRRWVGLAVRIDLVDVLSQATIGLAHAEAIRAVAHAWRGFSQARPAAYQSTVWHPVQGDQELEQAVSQVLSVLASSFRSFDLTEAQRTNAALALRSMLHGFVSFELGAGNPSPYSADDTFHHMIEVLITGVDALAAGKIATLT